MWMSLKATKFLGTSVLPHGRDYNLAAIQLTRFAVSRTSLFFRRKSREHNLCNIYQHDF
jgi:hypothetical protein